VPPSPLPPSLYCSLSYTWFLEELRTGGVLHPVHGSAAGIGSRRSSYATLAGFEAGRVVEHCICAKLRGVALSVIIVVWEDVHTTPRLATK
jgi:hypothetical protein